MVGLNATNSGGDGATSWEPDPNDPPSVDPVGVPDPEQFAPLAAMRDDASPAKAEGHEPAPSRAPNARRIVLIAVLALVGGLIVLDWWEFSHYWNASDPNAFNAIPFFGKTLFSIGYVWVAWRVFTR